MSRRSCAINSAWLRLGVSSRHPSSPRQPRAASRAQVADRLHSLAIHLLRAVRVEDDRSGLTGPRLSALSVVTFKGPITLTELAAAEHVTAPTMTRLVQGLEAAGMIRREAHSTDGRSIRLSATAQGRRALELARTRRIAAMQELLSELTAQEFKVVQSAILALEPRVKALLAP